MTDRKPLVEVGGLTRQIPSTDRTDVGVGVAFTDPSSSINASGGALTFTDADGTKGLNQIPVVGTSEIDFGAPPGANTASVLVSDPAILAGSVVDARIIAKDTVDHSADEHIADSPDVYAGDVVAGVGFYVYGSFTKNLGPTTYGKWAFSWSRT